MTVPLPVRVSLSDGRLLYEAQPRQVELHHAREPNVLYGGAAGGMKSHGLRWHGIMACLKYPELRVLLLRRQSTELETTHLLKVRTEVPPEVAKLNGGKGFLEFPNGSLIKFGHCNTDGDFASHLSSEWDMILIDEGGQFTPFMLTMFPSRLRTTKKLRPQLRIASNPGGPGHQWLKERFIEKHVRDETAPSYKPEEWRFIPSRVQDNPYINAEYIAKLESLPAQERAMYLDGSWDLPYGNLFETLEVGVHLVQAGGISTVRADWRHTVSADWGKSSTAPAIWWETDEGLDGNPLRTRAYQEWGPNETRPAVWAQGVVDMSARLPPSQEFPQGRLLLEKVVLDAAAFDAGQNFGPTAAEQMLPIFRKAGVRLMPSVKGPQSVRAGVDLLHTWLTNVEGFGPCMVIDDACPQLWASLVTIQRGNALKGQDSRVPALNQPQLHFFDACRYHVQGRPAPAVVGEMAALSRDVTMRALEADPLSQVNVWRERARAAITAGKQVPPRASAPKPQQTRAPWLRR